MPNKAYRIYLTVEIIASALYWMVFTVNSLYFVTTAHLDPLQLVLVGTVLEGSVFLFEVPTGVVADVYSRRLSVIIGFFLVGLGFLVEGAFPAFLPILLGQVLWGVGYTFTSGALVAWMTDEIGEQNAGAVLLRANKLGNLSAVGGVVVSILLGSLRVNLPILAGGLFFMLLSLYLLLEMPETGFRPTPGAQRTTWQHMLGTLRSGLGMVRRRPALVSILWVGWFLGLHSEGFDRLWVASLLNRFELPTLGGLLTQVGWFGILQVAALLLVAAATQWVERHGETQKAGQLIRLITAACGLLVLSLAGFALTGSLAGAVGLYLFISVLRQVINPLYTTWVNQRLDPQVRATVLSLSSQTDAFGQIAGGPLVGLIARQVSLTAGLLTSAGLLAPVLGILAGQMRTAEPEDAAPDPPFPAP